jgi:hypothetical protein
MIGFHRIQSNNALWGKVRGAGLKHNIYLSLLNVERGDPSYKRQQQQQPQPNSQLHRMISDGYPSQYVNVPMENHPFLIHGWLPKIFPDFPKVGTFMDFSTCHCSYFVPIVLLIFLHLYSSEEPLRHFYDVWTPFLLVQDRQCERHCTGPHWNIHGDFYTPTQNRKHTLARKTPKVIRLGSELEYARGIILCSVFMCFRHCFEHQIEPKYSNLSVIKSLQIIVN